MRKLMAWSLLLLSCSPAPLLGAAEPEQKAGEQPQPAAKSTITVSKETTYLDGPLDERGFVDYLKAVNAQSSAGVTPENNAAVALFRVLPLNELTQENLRKKFFAGLGIDPLPIEGDYLVSYADFVKGLPEAERPPVDEEDDNTWTYYPDAVLERSWTEKEFPVVARWLKEQEAKLNQGVEATRRPRYYAPLIGGESYALIAALIPDMQPCRELARDLTVRAMLRIGTGDAAGAQSDLLAVHRLGRLLAQTPTLIGQLVAIAVEGMAVRGDAALAHNGKLKSADLLAYRAELMKLKPRPRMVDSVDKMERYMMLDTATSMARGGPALLFDEFQLADNKYTLVMRTFDSFIKFGVDWDSVLVKMNRYMDRLVAALNTEDRAERQERIAAFEDDLAQIGKSMGDGQPLLRIALSGKNVRAAVAEELGNGLLSMLLPAVSRAFEAEERGMMQFQLAELGLSLAAYRADEGHWPKDLKELVPRYAQAIPPDLFVQQPLIYRVEGEKFLLYSRGPNGNDDAGRDRYADPAGDDITVGNLPLAAAPAPE